MKKNNGQQQQRQWIQSQITHSETQIQNAIAEACGFRIVLPQDWQNQLIHDRKTKLITCVFIEKQINSETGHKKYVLHLKRKNLPQLSTLKTILQIRFKRLRRKKNFTLIYNGNLTWIIQR